ncbi:UNVERIFIED_CONTAM: hypothetical protein PYX00_004000 [Menopon gallinae]|uniref:CHK kinase-like domain-containing protein n=1 Tax=Menopon gallinae TaxID=328185 RepID=A0AAW2I2K1_9NEOP
MMGSSAGQEEAANDSFFRQINTGSTTRVEESNPENDVLSKPEILSVLAKFFSSKDFVVDSYQFEKYPNPTSLSFGGEHLKLMITATDARQGNTGSTPSDKKTYTFFVKKLPPAPDPSFPPTMTQAFLKETELYSKVFVDFAEAQNPQSWKHWYPECYLTRPGEIMVLEDLLQSGYYRVARRDCLSKEQLLATMRALAAFHAASITLEEKMKETLLEAYEHIKLETDFICYPRTVFLETAIKSQLKLVEQLPGYSPVEMEMIKEQLPNLLRRIPTMAKASTKYRNVFIHGDLFPSNILFRDTNNNQLEATLVDYQMVRYAPPAMDLMMLLHLNQTKAFRIKEMQMMMQTYYNMFSEELTKNDICIQKVLPLKDFLESCREFTEWSTLQTVLYIQLHLLPDDIIEKYLSTPELYQKNMMVDGSQMVTEAFTKDPLYNTRMTEAMNDLIKTCIKLV